MPRVPTYDEFQASPQVLGPARVETSFTPDMAAIPGRQQQAMGQSMMQAGNALAQIAKEVQTDVNDAATKEADNALSDQLRKVLHDPQNGYLNMQGKDAVTMREDAVKTVQQYVQDGASNLTNDMQRKVYMEVANRRAEMALQKIDVHASQQAMVFNKGETVSRMNSARKDAVANVDDPIAFKTFKDTMIQEANEVARITGFGEDSDTAKALRLEQTTALHSDVINDLVNNDRSDQAQKYFEKNVNEIDPEKRDDLKKLLNISTVKEQSVDLARVLYTMHAGKDLTGTREELDQMLKDKKISAAMHDAAMKNLVELHNIKKSEQAEELAGQSTNLELQLKGRGLDSQLKMLETWVKDGTISPELRDATRVRLEHDWQLRKAQQAEGEKSLIGNATDWILHNPGKSVLDMPPAMYKALQGTGHLQAMVGFAKANGKFENDPQTWANIMTMPQSELKAMTPTEFFNRFRTKLDDHHLEQGYAMINALNGSKEDQHLQIFNANEMVKSSAVQLGIMPATGKPSESQAKDFDTFQAKVDDRVRVYEATVLQGKRKATTEDLKKILDEVAIDKVYERRTFMPNKEVPLVTMKPDDMTNAYVKIGGEEIPVASIPMTQRSLIIPALKAAGKPVTEQNIADYWVRGGKKK